MTAGDGVTVHAVRVPKQYVDRSVSLGGCRGDQSMPGLCRRWNSHLLRAAIPGLRDELDMSDAKPHLLTQFPHEPGCSSPGG